MKALVYRVKNLINSLIFLPGIFKIFVKLFALTALTGKGTNLCLKNRFLPLPVHFYSPIPDIEDLEKRKVWDVRSELKGIDFRSNAQIELLKTFGHNYSDECQWPLKTQSNPSIFYIQNPSFSYGCAASTHCVIRSYKPQTFIEIGSGMSSMVISKALQINKSDDDTPCNYIIVDPYPGDNIKSGILHFEELVENRVELLDPKFFTILQKNDILFIDSGHCVRIGGDVNFLYLEVLPRLKPGVIIHIHDIALPYEYSKTYTVSESFRQLWTEQYLLQSFLTFNKQFEIMLAMNFLMVDHIDLFKKIFPYYDPQIHPFNSGSFWIRRKPDQ